MKKILTIVFVLFLTGCGNKIEHYKKFADTALNFFESSNYSSKEFSENENILLNKYLSTLTHENQIIDLDDYIDKSEDYYTNENNSYGVYVENGKCYIKYDDISFQKLESGADIEDEMIAKIVCNNYFVTIMSSQFIDYNEIQNDERYNYRYLGYINDDTKYQFIYRSYYDGSGLVISVDTKNNKIVDLSVTETNVNDYIITEEKNNKVGLVIVLLVPISLVILVIYVIKKIRNNNKF